MMGVRITLYREHQQDRKVGQPDADGLLPARRRAGGLGRKPALGAADPVLVAGPHPRRPAFQPHTARQGFFPAGQGGRIGKAQHDLILVAAFGRLQHARPEKARKPRREDFALAHPGQEIAIALGRDVPGNQHGHRGGKSGTGHGGTPGQRCSVLCHANAVTRTRTVHMEKTHGNQPARRRGGSDSGVRALRDRPRQQPGGRAGHPVLG
ncbi:hypothetical protein G6F35_013077 [Rhizopus arrhizus]|nr:hypothetical protein G6F35_013077 [Rhizopus arrhizus]